MGGKRRPKDLKAAQSAFEACKKSCREQLGLGARGRLNGEEIEKFNRLMYSLFTEALKTNLSLDDTTADEIARTSIALKGVPERPWFAPPEMGHVEGDAAIDLDPQQHMQALPLTLTGLPLMPHAEIDASHLAASGRAAGVAPQPAIASPSGFHAAGLHTLAAAAGNSNAVDPSSLLRQCGSLMLQLADAKDENEQLKKAQDREVQQLHEENRKLAAENIKLTEELSSLRPHSVDRARNHWAEADASARPAGLDEAQEGLRVAEENGAMDGAIRGAL